MPRQILQNLDDRGPLRVMFVITSMPVGGAETLLVNLMRRIDRDRFLPELCCLKELGPLGEELAAEIPTHSRLLAGKWDVGIWPRLTRLLRSRRTDVVVTVGAGDKMFWGRLAAWGAGAPVVLSALHSTGWPDGVGRLNRLLTPLTDYFIAVAEGHSRHLIERERFPAAKVRVIPNGIDTERFRSRPEWRGALRSELGVPLGAPVCGIVAALRPEKNHRLFLETAARVYVQLPEAHFLIVGDGPLRGELETHAAELGLGECAHFLGSRSDVPEILAALDLFALTSDNEANPVSILEAMAAGLPVAATQVGSVAESVKEGVTGLLSAAGDCAGAVRCWLELLGQRDRGEQMGRIGREHVVAHGSLDVMVRGYEQLMEEAYRAKSRPASPLGNRPPATAPAESKTAP